MRKKAAALVLLLAIVKLYSGEVWQPFKFKEKEYFKYEARVVEEGKEQKGFYILDVNRVSEGKYKIHVKAKLGENEFETSFTGEESNLYSSLMAQAMFYPAAMPLLTTLFAPFWGAYFVGHNWEVGSYWSVKTEDGTKISFKIESECEHAGLKGKKGVWKENGTTRAEFCISPKVALPLRVFFRDESGHTYEMTLVEYGD